MATLTKQKARKEYLCSKCGTAILVGEEYYRFSKTRFQKPKIRCYRCKPTRVEMTNSDFMASIYAYEDEFLANISLDAYDSMEDLIEEAKMYIEELRDEQEEKLDNLPENLREAPVGQLIQERYDALEEMLSNIDSIDYFEDDTITEEEQQARREDILSDLQAISYDGP